jgi:hypothetical protein
LRERKNVGTDLNADRAEGVVDVVDVVTDNDVVTDDDVASETEVATETDGAVATSDGRASAAEAGQSAATVADTGGTPGFVAVLLAALSAAAGATHFALTPQHAAEWATEGLLFAITGWLQVSAAAWSTWRPWRRTCGAARWVFPSGL